MRTTLFLATNALFACSHQVPDSTTRMSTEARIERLASVACGRYADCEGYGMARMYSSAAVCEHDYKVKALTAWSDCPDGRLNWVNFDACVESVKELTCANEIWNGTLASGMCAAEKVCAANP